MRDTKKKIARADQNSSKNEQQIYQRYVSHKTVSDRNTRYKKL